MLTALRLFFIAVLLTVFFSKEVFVFNDTLVIGVVFLAVFRFMVSTLTPVVTRLFDESRSSLTNEFSTVFKEDENYTRYMVNENKKQVNSIYSIKTNLYFNYGSRTAFID